MESEKINDIVEGTFTKVDLSVMNPLAELI